MKKISLYSLVIMVIACVLTSCYKDIGNYNYHDINRVAFKNIDTVKGYQVLYGDTLSINPSLVMTQDQNHSAGYAYEWSLRIGNAQVAAGLPASPLRDSVLSTSLNLKVKIGLTPGSYSLQYRVTDKNTGVQFHVRVTLTVTTAVYEGYMVLNDVNGQSRLDMLTYNQAAGTFTQYTDALKKMGSTLPMQGQPYQVFSMIYTNSSISAQNYGIFILNGSGTSRIDQETFAYNPNLGIRYLFVGDVPLTFAPQRIIGELTSGVYPMFYLYDHGNIYSYSTFVGYSFKYAPLNVYTASGAPFNVSPYIVTNGTVGVMYNTDKQNFVTAASYNSTSLTDVAPAFNYPTGLNLVFMDKDYNNNAFAVLKDPATLKNYLMRFKIGSAQNYYQEVTAPDFATATNFALSPDLGYLFYSAGGKVYEYDLALKISTLMIDKGTSAISYLSFQRFYNRAVKTTTYGVWSLYLTVCSYDPAGAAGSNGTFERYSIPPVNGQIVKVNSWTGFGKIVSVAYRER